MKLGSSKIKQSAKLKTTAPNNEWFKNVVKSIGYASADIIKETVPSAFEFVSTNGKEAMELHQQLRQDGSKSITKMVSDSVFKNPYIKIASDAIANTKEDLKTGKLYNKERQDKSVTGDDDFNFDVGFDDDDFSFGDDDSDLPEASESESGVTNVKKVTVNNINANISKNNPMVQSLEKQSEVMVGLAEASQRTSVALATTSYTLTSKIASDLMTGITSVNDNLSALVNFNNDSMSKYVAASLQYYEESLTVLKDAISTKAPEVEAKESNASSEEDIFLSRGGLNIKNYMGRVKKNVKTTIESDLMLNSIYSAVSDKQTWEMLAASPLTAIPTMLSKVLIPTMVRDSAKKFDESLEAFFPALLQKFNRMSNNDDNWVVKTLGQIFGYNPKTLSTVEIDKYNKGDMNFNGITQKAITEVIPTYLRKILSAISGSNEMIFDYDKAVFVDYMTTKENIKKEERQALFSQMETYSELKNRLDAIEFTDEANKKNMMNEFDNMMYKLARSKGGANPNIIKNKNGEIVDQFKEMFNSEFVEIFRSAVLSLDPAQQMKLMGSDIYKAKEGLSRRVESIQNNIGLSVVPTIEAWDSSEDYKKDAKTEKFVRKDPLSHLTKDKFGKTTLEYIREVRDILLEGIITYPAGGGESGSYRDRNRVRRTRNNNEPDDTASRIKLKRQSRLDVIAEENNREDERERELNTRTIKNYTESDLNRKEAKGIKVARSTSDLIADMTNEQMVDMFRNYVQIRDSDEEASNQQSNAGGWISKIFAKGGKKVESVRDMFDNVVSLPARVVSNVLSELDGGLYKLVFGVNPDGSDRSFLSKVVTSVKESFGGFFDWTKEKFFNPINEALFGEDGFFTKIKNSEAMEKLKKFGNKMADWAFGNMDETGHRRNGAFSEAFNEVADMGREVGSVFTGREYIDRHGNVHAANDDSVFGNINAFTGTAWTNARTYLFGNRQRQSTTQPVTNESYDQINLDDYMTSVAQQRAQNQETNIAQNTQGQQLDLFDQMGNGGNGVMSNIMNWLKDNVKLKYKVSTNETEGEEKTISFGQDVDEEVGGGGIAPTMLNGFPYFSQRDPRYANYSYNLSTGKGGGDSLSFGDRGCGPAALAMVASGLGRDADPLELADLATETGHSVEGGTKGSFFSSIGDKLGLNVKEKQTDESKVNSAIRSGKPIIFRGRKTTDAATPFTDDGHFVVGVGGKDGKININDPNGPMTSGTYDVKDIVSESNKMWTFDDLGKGGSKNKRKDSKNDLGKGSSRNDVGKGKDESYNGVGSWMKDVVTDESEEIRGVFGELIDGFRLAGQDMIDLTFGGKTEEDDERKARKFHTNFRAALPKGIAGGMIGGGIGALVSATGGMGLLGSLFLPGGPVGAAILGTAVGFASSSEKLKNWIFGEQDPEDTSKRLGGFIGQGTQDFFKKHKNTIIGGATIGGLKGVLTGAGLLPGLLFGGPLTGAIMGAGVGLALRSERFQNMVFGEDDEETGEKVGGMLSKSYNYVSKHKKLIGGAGIGLLGGAATGAVLSSMGLMGSAFFLGPVGGAIAGAGLGIAAASEKWRDKVFGTLDEDTNKREGGLLNEVKSNIIHEVLEPIKLGARETADSFKFWFEEKIILPVADFFGPMKTAMGMMFQDTLWAIQDIGAGVKATFQKYIGEPMNQFLHDKIFKPLRDIFGGLWKGATKITQTILGAPFKLLGMANKGAAGFVQKRATKRKAKSDKYAEQMQIYEQQMEVDGDLSLEDQIKYETLKKKRDRYFIADDDKRLTARTDYETRLAERKQDIATRREEAAKDLANRKQDLLKRNEFRRIFGEKYDYNEEALDKYKSLFSLEDGKKVKGRRARKALANRANEFITNFNSSGGQAPSDENVKEMKDDIKANLSPIRKAAEGVEKEIKAAGIWLQNIYNTIVNKAYGAITNEDGKIGKIAAGVEGFGDAATRQALLLSIQANQYTQDAKDFLGKHAGVLAEKGKHKINTATDFLGRKAGDVVEFGKNKVNGAIEVADLVSEGINEIGESRLAQSRDTRERLKQERSVYKVRRLKRYMPDIDDITDDEGNGGRSNISWKKPKRAKSNEGKGGSKDPSWLMHGKGKDIEETPKIVEKSEVPKEDKSKKKEGGFLASLGNSMFGALKKFDKVNDKEEEEKAQLKDKKSKLAEKQKDVSSKNYEALNAQLVAKKKEEEERNWKDKLLSAVTNIKEKTQEHLVNWTDIFSKKGLITMGLLAALPKILDFIKDPAQFIKDTLSSIFNSIKISIGWLFGKDNDGRKDANGETIENTGLIDSTTRLGRNVADKTVRYLADPDTLGGKAVKFGKQVGGKVVEKGKKIGSNLIEKGKNFIDDVPSLLDKGKSFFKTRKLSEGAADLYKQGFRNADELADLGIRNIDDLAMMGVKNIDDLAALGIKSADDFSRFGIKTVDDLAKFGIDITNKKTAKTLSKFGISVTEGFVEQAGPGKLAQLGSAVTGAMNKFTDPLLTTGKNVASTVAEKGTKLATTVAESGKNIATSGLELGKKLVSKPANAISNVAESGKNIATKSVSAVVEVGQKATNNKFVKAVLDWVQSVFSSKAVIKELGETGAAKALKEITSKISGAFTEKVLSKFTNKISLALAEAGGRLAAGVSTGGIVTAGFAITDFIAGAVNAERLFEIPAGTATFEMTTISALLQTALGVGMVGPIIDVANEIIAEVLGLNILSMIASIMYSAIVSDEKALELENLQSELDKAYEAYKKANGLDDITKKAYIDLTNPSFGTKVINTAKNVGNTLTGNVFNDNEIRKQLGLGDNVQVTLKDRISMGAASLVQTLSFGNVKSEDVIQNIYGIQTDIANKAKDMWEGTKEIASEWWGGAKEKVSDAASSAGKVITGWMGLYDENGEPLPLGTVISDVKDEAKDKIKSFVKSTKDSASQWWEDTSTKLSEDFKTLKDNLGKGMDELNKGLGRLMGFEDENGNAISLTDAVKNKWSNTVSKASNLWSSFKNWISNDSKNSAQVDIANRNSAADAGMGGFGEAIPKNIGARGCGPTAMAMVTSRMTGAAVDPVMMSKLATDSGFAGTYGTNGQFFNYAADQFGISATQTKTSAQNLTSALNSGQPVILRGQSNGDSNSAFTRAGHYVVAVGAKDGKVVINDPRGEQYSGVYNMSDVVNQSNVMWSFRNSRAAIDKTTPIVLGGASTDNVPGELILEYALIHLGKPYVWGGNGPKNFDCSGLVNYVVKQAGIKLPSSRPTAEVWRKNVKSISKSDLKVGDLGFLVKNGKATHVGIYAGDGKWCHAEGGPGENGAGGSVVLNDRTYWTHFGRISGVVGSSTSYDTSSSSSYNSSSANTGTPSIISNIAGYLSNVFNKGINSAVTGNMDTFQTYQEYLASNNSSGSSNSGSDANYTDTFGAVSLGSRKTSADLLNKTLGGKLAGKGATIVSIGNKYGVDPGFLAALMHHETGNGTNSGIINKNNPGGIMDAATGWKTQKSFATLNEGIEYTASNLKKNYLSKGLTTIDKIGPVYAPSKAENDPNNLNQYWVGNVKKLYNNTYTSETGYGGFGEGFTTKEPAFAFSSSFKPQTSSVSSNPISETSTFAFGESFEPMSESSSFTFGDKIGDLGGMRNYTSTPPQVIEFSNNNVESDDRVVDVMETMVEVLRTIAENTNATNSNIKNAMTNAINRISTSNASINVNNMNSSGKTVSQTSSTYSAKEIANRSIAQRIAAGKFA